MTITRLPMHLRLLTIAGAALSLAACGEQGEPPTGPRPTGPTGRIRFVNALPNATAGARPLNVAIDGVPLTANLAFGATTPYLAALAGDRQLLVQRTADTTVHTLETAFAVAENVDHTLLASGTAAAPVLTTITDDVAAPAAGQVKIRALHAAATTGPLDVYITLTSNTTPLTGLTPAVSGLAYRAASAYVELPAGAYTIRFTAAGTKTPVLATVTTGTAALAAGAIRTAVALDNAAGTGALSAAVLVDR